MSGLFKRGDYVDRNKGQYRFPGMVLSTYDNMGVTMCDVRLAGFRTIHIFREKDLKLISKEDFDYIDDGIIKLLEEIDG